MRILSILAFAVLTGCATTPTPLNQAQNVPAERIYYKDQPGSPAAHIVVVRDTGLQAAGVYAHFFINGMRAAALNPGEKLSMDIPSGDYSFAVHLTDPLNAEEPYSIDQMIKSGGTYYYRVLVDHSGARIQRFSPDASFH